MSQPTFNLTVPAQKGFVLVTALIFLVVLTLVAVTAVKSTGLELRMSSNNAVHTEAFEVAEAPRQLIGRLIDVLGFNLESGWPVAKGGETPDSQFAYTIPAALTIYDASLTTTGAPANWFTDIPETGFNYSTFTRRAKYDANVAGSGTASFQLTADIDVQRMRSAPIAGNSLGTGTYGGPPKISLFFYITVRGNDPGSTANYETSSVYRYVPSN